MTKVEVRYATMADAVAFWGALPRRSFIGAAMVVDGEIMGIGGFIYEPTHMKAFCDLKPEAYRYRKAIVRGARLAMAKAAGKRMRLLAVRDESVPTSETFLKAFGFEFLDNSGSGEVWEWRRQQSL